MKKYISFDESLKLSFEEWEQIRKHNESLPEGHKDRIIIEDPISNMTLEEADEFLHSKGFITLEESQERINALFDKYAARMKPENDEDFREFYAFMDKQDALLVPYERMQQADYQRTLGDIDEIEYSKIFVDLCLSYYHDRGVRKFHSNIVRDLKRHIQNIRELLRRGQYDHNRWKRAMPFETCIEDGEKLVHQLDPTFKREIQLRKQNVLKVTPFRKPDMKKAPVKASVANKYIGFGVAGSSTAAYAEEIAHNGGDVNVDDYTTDNVVFVSINGNRPWAEPMQEKTIELARHALLHGAVLITDNEYHRNRKYNNGERLLAEALLDAGASYEEQTIGGITIGVWSHACVDKK